MKARRFWRILRLAIFFLAMVTVFRGIFQGIFYSPKNGPYPMDWTSADARRHQCWIRDVEVQQKALEGGKRKVPIEEAWIEAATEEAHFLVWFPYQKRLDLNFLCFSIPISNNAGYTFTLDGHNEDFAVLGTSDKFIYYARSENDRADPRPATARYSAWYTDEEGQRTHEAGTVMFTPVTPK
jgi:hypothetical protein